MIRIFNSDKGRFFNKKFDILAVKTDNTIKKKLVVDIDNSWTAKLIFPTTTAVSALKNYKM